MKTKNFLKANSKILLAATLILTVAITMFTIPAKAVTYYNYFQKPEKNATYTVGDTIEISAWAGSVRTYTKFDAWGNPGTTTYETMPATIKVLKGNEEVLNKKFTYTESTSLETTFTPEDPGEYTLELYSLPPGLGLYDETIHDRLTITVEKKEEPVNDKKTDSAVDKKNDSKKSEGKKQTVKKSATKKVKKVNTLKVKAKTATVKYKKVKKKAQTLAVTKVVKFNKKGQGKLTYTKKSGNKKITINKKTGKIKVKKGIKKGTYRVKMKIKASGNASYKAITKTVTFKIVVK